MALPNQEASAALHTATIVTKSIARKSQASLVPISSISLKCMCVCVRSQAIPFRTLETFSSDEIVCKYITDANIRRQYLENVYRYLVKRKYFSLVRKLVAEKVPPLYEPIGSPPTPLSETLLQMVQHPLKLLTATHRPSTDTQASLIGQECATIILSSFVDEILVPACTPAIRFFVIPCLSRWPAFPFLHLLQHLHESIGEQSRPDASAKQRQRTEQVFASSPCFESVLLLDELHQSHIDGDIALVKHYIRIIGRFSNNLRRLEQRSRQSIFQHMDTDGTEDYDSDDDDSPPASYNQYTAILADERDCLLNAITMLNADKRVRIIVEHNDCFLDDDGTMHSLCRICHNLMLYHRAAVREYR